MDTSKFDSQIQKLETGNINLKNEMDVVKTTLIEETNYFILDFTQKSIDRAVIAKSEHTKSLGSVKLKNLKTDLNQTLDELPSKVEQQLGDNSLWIHLSGLPDDIENQSLPAYQLEKQFTKNFNEAVRELFGYTGQLLLKYEYEKPGDRDAPWSERSGQLPRYNLAVSPNPKMLDLIERYKYLLERLVKNHLLIKKIKKQKSEAEAKNLWDTA